jgi:hypothetical protein
MRRSVTAAVCLPQPNESSTVDRVACAAAARAVPADVFIRIREEPMDRATPPPPNEGAPTTDATGDVTRDRANHTGDEASDRSAGANPPRTTTGNVTAPKFGAAGSGGAEYEGELPKD